VRRLIRKPAKVAEMAQLIGGRLRDELAP